MLFKNILRFELCFSHRILARANSSWNIVTGICVERLPVVTPPINEIQKQFKDLLWTIEVENSLKSDHELRHENDKKQAELLKSETVEVDLENVSKITAQDFEDSSSEELANFKFSSIETDADKKGDLTSIERCLQRHLILVTEQKLGKDVKAILPQGHWKEGETLRQTAERVLQEHCGPELKVTFLSNAPCGFYKYKYPTEMDGRIGAKVFFYYANYKDGEVSKKTKSKWLTRKEMSELLPQRYDKTIREFLIEETY